MLALPCPAGSIYDPFLLVCVSRDCDRSLDASCSVSNPSTAPFCPFEQRLENGVCVPSSSTFVTMVYESGGEVGALSWLPVIVAVGIAYVLYLVFRKAPQ